MVIYQETRGKPKGVKLDETGNRHKVIAAAVQLLPMWPLVQVSGGSALTRCRFVVAL